MEAAAPIVNLPPTERMLAAGFNKPKAPKLEECIHHFFGETLAGAHDALVDVRACARVYFHLQTLKAQAA
jgi:DNA polymerase-3 subunit epsilon